MAVYRGWNAKLYKDGVEIGYVKEVRVDIDHSIEYYFEAGNREPATTIEGPLDIKGRMAKAFVNTTYLSLLNNTGELESFTLAITIYNMTLYLYNCKFSKGSLSIPQDGVLLEDYDFLATSFQIVPS